jgi:hypothetical protein
MSAMPPDAASAAPAPLRANRRPLWAHALAQNVGLELAAVILAATILGYCGAFYAQQQRLPGGFEITRPSTTPCRWRSPGWRRRWWC